MKHFLIIIFLFAFSSTFSQSYFDRQNDTCCLIQREKISSAKWHVKYNDRCSGFSFIADVELCKGEYKKDGAYIENYFFDTNAVRRRGFYINNKECGLWQEFYKNGKLKFQGSCKPVSYILNKKYPGRIIRVDWEKPFDTLFLDNTKSVIDSLKKIVWYADSLIIPKSQFKSVMVFPSDYSLKVGEWNYYTENGELYKKEYYKEGVLIQSKIY